jgi:GTP pyrophosphokinase
MLDPILPDKYNVTDCSLSITPVETQETPEQLRDNLYATIERLKPGADLTDLKAAVDLAMEAHKDQRRKSGEPYIIHPLCVATILAEMEMDKSSIIAGVLHDVVEDTDYTLDDVRERFGNTVAMLVDGVTKLTNLTWDAGKEDKQAENLRKMFLAMAKDIRVIIIKLADRTHNMRTLQYMKPEKQKEKARETLDIYAPLAGRLGISRLKIELDNLSLSYLEPEKYKKLIEDVDLRKQQREEYISGIVDEVKKTIQEAGIECEVYGRVKHYFSIYKKMLIQNKNLDQIYDLFAVRVLVNSLADCYAVLGIIHEIYTPVPGRFKDYIAVPKPNHYQSLHTTLIGKTGIPFEIQIRTYDMHRVAEYGIAAHWKYKEGGPPEMTKDEEKLSWLRQILEWQHDVQDNSEFLKTVKSDLDIFSEEVYCFTPRGDVVTLPKGSTPVDFAYMIHSAVGNRMTGARVNDRMVTLDYRLKSGDRVDIITSLNSKGPSRDWLKLVKSTQARTKINQWFRNQDKTVNIQRGRELVERYCKVHALPLAEFNKPEYQEKVLNKYGFKDWETMLAAVGYGGVKEGQIVNRMVDEWRKDQKPDVDEDETRRKLAELGGSGSESGHHTTSKSGIIVKGLNDLAVHFSRCCNPIPGDEIVGFVTRGRGVSIHRTDCVNIANLPDIERNRLIEAEWQAATDSAPQSYQTEIQLFAMNSPHLLSDILKTISEQEIEVGSINSNENRNGMVTCSIKFRTKNIDDAQRVMARLRQIDGVRDVQRPKG